MAYYHAARLARAREADTFSVAFDEPGMECEVTPRSEGNFSAAGDPIALVAVAVFAAFYSLAPRRESYEAFPTHTLGVALADGDTVAGDRAPVSVSEKLAALEPEFGSGASKDGERGAWEQNAEANEKVCAERLERQKHMQEAADGQSVEKDGEPSEEDRPGVEQTRADRTRTVSGSP